MMQKAKWTFMLYLAGDNNLSDAGDADLAEIRAIGSTRDVNIVAQFDNAGDAGTQRFLIQKDGLNETVDDRGETDSGSPEMLTDFVNWTTTTYPADRYALVLWNHGSGWEPSEVDRIARSVGSRDYNARELNERSSSKLGRVLFRTTLEKVFEVDAPNERAICSDDGSGHSLDTVELGNVLNQVVRGLDGPIDVLGMDACLMSNFEVAYQVRPYAKFVVASEELEPNQGWPYTPIVDWLTKNPDASSADFAAGIVREYVESYARTTYRGPVTQSALNLSHAESFAGRLNDLAAALEQRMADAYQSIWMAQRKSKSFWDYTLWDIKQFSEELRARGSNDLAPPLDAVQQALQVGDGQFVHAEAHRGAEVEHCGGVSVYMPPMKPPSRFYGDLDFAKDTRWLSMLTAYAQA